ncbi:subclass B3 metallo-beta-lactamase [Dyella sp. RRB7]|uniref:subclass B3 metallo-beta-lactamase n=1 Tax=Dyella sp. RRB7 TaxID=2919502 RepID=UPI001FA97002|nr:subclass B3 metallo-beta-lactamase [Dyella sp. RRB7]
MKAWVAIALTASFTATVHADPAAWTQAQKPFRIYGNTYYVGTMGLSAILISTSDGLVLIDGTLPQNVPLIETNIRALGFRVEDIKVILNTHPHGDHAGGIAALAGDSGAKVMASAKAAWALEHGGDNPNDPQYGMNAPYPKLTKVTVVQDGGTVTLGSQTLYMHAMPGHTPGGTGWTWRSCEQGRCLNMVYADSISLLSNKTYRYTDPTQPERLAGYRTTIATLRQLPCDILMVPHPDAIDFLGKLPQLQPDKPNPWLDTNACRAYADQAQANLERRVKEEAAKPVANHKGANG